MNAYDKLMEQLVALETEIRENEALIKELRDARERLFGKLEEEASR